ncbi:MAG: serine/threonine-protein kinase [Syntrophomonas sp.]
MQISRLCPGCFSEKTSDETCPYCGFRVGIQPNSPFYLPAQTILRGKYLLGRVLGQGGFGVTYLGWDLDLGIKLAIKEYLPREFAGRSTGEMSITPYSGQAGNFFAKGLERFLDEAKTLARLEGHPNIVSVRDFFRENGTAYLVMNYLEGMTLKEYLNRRGTVLDFASAFQILSPVMDGLKQVHAYDILHRDISPDNIFITDTGMVKILDFGAARQALGEHSKSLSVILKPGFAPEEQYRSKGRQGPWTDVYAVAATMYLMLCGKTPPEPLDRMSGEPIYTPSQLGVAVSPAGEAALMKGLAVKAEHRFQTMTEFQQALYAGLTQSTGPASYSAPQPVQVEPQASKSLFSMPQVFSGPGPQVQPAAPVESQYLPPAPQGGADPGNRNIILFAAAGLICVFLIIVGIYYYQSEEPSNTGQVSVATNSTSSNTSNQFSSSGPEKVVKDFYDSVAKKDAKTVNSLLSGDALGQWSDFQFTSSDYTLSYRITDVQSVNSNQVRVTAEVQLTVVDQPQMHFRDVWLVENKGGRWTIVSLLGETEL